MLGELDEALVTGTRALEIAGRLGDLRLRILTTTYLEQAHYFRGDYERVVELATDNLAALPADWVYESFGTAIPIIDLRSLLAGQEPRRARPIRRGGPVRGRGAPARRADAACVHRRSWPTSPRAGFTSSRATGRRRAPLIEHGIAAFRTGNVVLNLPHAVACSAWVLAQLGEASEALTRLQEGEQLLERQAARGFVGHHGGPTTRWVAPLCCSAGSTRRGAWPTARSTILRRHPGSRPMRCTCSATSRPIPTGSMPRAARPTTARRSRSPSRAACAPSSPTATSASAGSTGARGKRAQAREHLTIATTMYREMDMTFWLEHAEEGARRV